MRLVTGQEAAPSQNDQVEYEVKAQSFLGLGSFGFMQVGNKALEYYNEKNAKDYIQIPWTEVDYISASVVGKKINRWVVFTLHNGHYAFSTRDNKATLRAIREYVPADRLLRSQNMVDVAKFYGGKLKGVFQRKS